VLAGEPIEETAAQRLLDLPEASACRGVDEVQMDARAGHRDVGEAAFFLDSGRVLTAVEVRHEVLLHAGHEDDVELEPLGHVRGHEHHRVLVGGAALVQIGHQRDLIQKRRE
jgi:hypothetical protein